MEVPHRTMHDAATSEKGRGVQREKNGSQDKKMMSLQHGLVHNQKTILNELDENNTFFDNFVDMIPANLYVAGNTGDEKYNPKYRKGQHKESKQSRRARNKISRNIKFDPNLSESTRQTQRRKEEEEFDTDSDDGEQESSPEQVNNYEEGNNNYIEEKKDASNDILSTPQALQNLSRIETLRAKLHAKLEEKRSKRPGGVDESNRNSSVISKRAARRAEKQRRIELAKRRNRGGSTKIGSNLNKNGSDSIVDKSNLNEKDLGGSKLISNVSTISNSKDDLFGIDFGGISGLDDKADISNYRNTNKSLKNIGKKKSLERLLVEAETKSKRLEQLKASTDLNDKAKAKRIKWGDTLKAASGVRSKDDTTVLKKAIKRKTKKKAKSQESWKARMEQVQDKTDERQKIRQHNISQRKMGGSAGANLSKKQIANEDVDIVNSSIGDKKKRPRLGPYSGKSRAGFEGKKQNFINDGKSHEEKRM